MEGKMMDTTIQGKDMIGAPASVVCGTDDGGEAVTFWIKVEAGPYSVVYLNHEQLVELIKEASQAARVVD